MKKKTQYWWLLGLFIPVVGLILYFVWNNKSKDKANNILIGTIIGFCISGFIFLYYSQRLSKYENRTIEEWKEDINSGNEVVTIFGASYCSHCKEYKPVIFKLANENNINLYFFEIDTKSDNEKNELVNTFEIGNFEGDVPYTFIYKDKEFVVSDIGFSDEQTTIEFLKEYGVIKN